MTICCEALKETLILKKAKQILTKTPTRMLTLLCWKNVAILSMISFQLFKFINIMVKDKPKNTQSLID